jgi:hypothetical protein
MVTGLIYGVLFIAGALLATMMTSGPNQEGMEANTLESFQTTTSNEGSVVTIVIGRAKVTGNLLWFGNLETVALPTSGGGKGGGDAPAGSSGYSYYMDIWQGLCIGPGVSIETLWEQNKEIDNEGYILNPGDELTFPTPRGPSPVVAVGEPEILGDLLIPYAAVLLVRM